MKIPHPWHHPEYEQYSDQLDIISSDNIVKGQFVSGVTMGFETRLSDNHWRRWLFNSIDFAETMKTINAQYPKEEFEIIEIGFHPVLYQDLFLPVLQTPMHSDDKPLESLISYCKRISN